MMKKPSLQLPDYAIYSDSWDQKKGYLFYLDDEDMKVIQELMIAGRRFQLLPEAIQKEAIGNTGIPDE